VAVGVPMTLMVRWLTSMGSSGLGRLLTAFCVSLAYRYKRWLALGTHHKVSRQHKGPTSGSRRTS